HVPNAPAGPTAAEQAAQVANLPYNRLSDFTELRLGAVGQQYSLTRRPGVYSVAMYGDLTTTRQRNGTSLFWHPSAGTFIIAFNFEDRDYWGTITDAGGNSALQAVTATHHAGAD